MNPIFLCKGPSIETIYFLMVCMVLSFCLGCYVFYRLFNYPIYTSIKDDAWYEKIIYAFCFLVAGILSATVSLMALVAIAAGFMLLLQR